MIKKKKILTSLIIMSGGSGKRLWPISRQELPKQFIKLFKNRSLFQIAIERFSKFKSNSLSFTKNIVVANEQHRFLIADQINEITQLKNFSILLEPYSKNTASAVTFSALEILKAQKDSVMVVSPSDHIIKNQRKFNTAIVNSIKQAAKGGVVILGASPTYASSNYGYIKFIKSSSLFKDVIDFIEKPSTKKANLYFASNEYLWNTGIFIFKASEWLNALKLSRPDILEACSKACLNSSKDDIFIRPDASLYKKIMAESIDYAVMEKIKDLNIPIKTIELDSPWDDLGSWENLSLYFKSDKKGNAIKGDVNLYNSFNNIVISEKRLISTANISDLVIVDTPDAILVSKKNNSIGLKNMVSILEDKKRPEVIRHLKVYRPWGWYETILEGKAFKVKRINVKPLHSLSLQKHNHRAEHWVVVKGKAKVITSSGAIVLRTNESAFIKRGSLHRLSNTTKNSLEIIEVQTGDYLEEDDIIRVEDKYGR